LCLLYILQKDPTNKKLPEVRTLLTNAWTRVLEGVLRLGPNQFLAESKVPAEPTRINLTVALDLAYADGQIGELNLIEELAR